MLFLVDSLDAYQLLRAEMNGGDTITEYRFLTNDLYGAYSGKERYDLMRIVMIRFGKETDASGSELIRMLGTLVSGEVEPEKKLAILEKEFSIELTVELKGGLAHMCNWSEIVAEEAMERGMEKGNALKLTENIESLMANFHLPLEKACAALNETVEAYQSAKKLLS